MKLFFFPSFPCWKRFCVWVGSVHLCNMHVPVWIVELIENMFELAVLPLLSPGVSAAVSSAHSTEPPGTGTWQRGLCFSSENGHGQARKAVENHLLAGPWRPICGASSMPAFVGLGSSWCQGFVVKPWKLFAFPWEPQEELWAKLQTDLCPSTSPTVSLQFMGFFQPDSVKGSFK